MLPEIVQSPVHMTMPVAGRPLKLERQKDDGIPAIHTLRW